jgi:cyanate lyase
VADGGALQGLAGHLGADRSEEFGDGIMSAIDFRMDLQRQPDPNGDRVSIAMSGKFLPYRTY